MLKSAAGYLRLSHKNSVERGVSIPRQREFIDKFAKERGYKVTFYEDLAISGEKTHNRPAFMKMAQDMSKHGYMAIIAYDWSRITRDYFDDRNFTKFKWACEDLGIDILSVTEPYEKGTMPFNIVQAIATQQRKDIAKKVKDSMWSMARRGNWCGGVVKYGFQKENKKLVINKYEAKVVKFMFELFHIHRSFLKVTDILNKKGLRTREGIIWSRSSVRRHLTDPIYCGYLLYGRRAGGSTKAKPVDGYIKVRGHFEPIIQEQYFEQTQAIVRSITYNEQRKKDRTYLLTGLIRCECGHRMYGYIHPRMTKSGIIEHFYYRCTGNIHYGKIHEYRSYLGHDIEDTVWNYIIERASLDGVDEVDVKRIEEDLLPGLKEQLSKHRKSRSNLVSRLKLDIIPEQEMKLEIATQDQAIAEIEESIRNLEFDRTKEEKKRKQGLLEQVNEYGQDIRELSTLEQRDILRELIKKVVVHRDGTLEIMAYDEMVSLEKF